MKRYSNLDMIGNQITRVVIELVSVLPVTDLKIGRIVYLTTDDKFYGYTSSGWKEVTPDMFPGYAYLDPADDNTKQITKWSEPSLTPDAEDDGAKAVDEHSHKDDYVTAAQVATTLRNLRRFDDPSIDNNKNHYGYPVYDVNGQLTSIDTTKIVADYQWSDLLKNRMMIPRIAANGSVVESPFFVDGGWYKLTTRDQFDTVIPTSGCVVENIKHMAEYILGVAYANLGNGIFATNSSGETIWISTTAGSNEEKILSTTSDGVRVHYTVTTTVDESSTDTQIPTAKAVNTAIEEVTIPTQALESLGIRNMAPGQTGCKHIAHRGVYVAPENTVVGMQAAKAYGFDFVEFDVKWSKDDVPICIHDDTVDRVTDNEYTGNVVDFTYDELKQMDVGKYKNPENSDIYTGTTIPDLNRMLICCRMLRLHPYIEIHTTSPKWTAEKVKQCVDKVKELHMERDVTWICSNTTWLKEVLKEDPSARVGWATSTFSTKAHIDTLLELKTPYNEIFLDFASDNTVSGSQEATNTAAQLCRDNDIPFEVFCTTSGNQGCIDANWYCTGSTSDRFRLFDQLLSSNNTVFNPIWGTGDDMSFPQYASGTWHEYCVSYDRHILSIGRVIDTCIDFIWNGPNTGGAADHTEYTIFSPAHNTLEMKCVPRYDKYFTIMGIKDDDPTTPHWFALLKICGKLSETPGDIVMLYNNAPTGCHFRHTIFYAI